MPRITGVRDANAIRDGRGEVARLVRALTCDTAKKPEHCRGGMRCEEAAP